MSDTGLVTDPGAKVFLDGNVRSPAELAGLLNLLLHTSHPECEADLANSPVPQLRVDLCYSVNQAHESVFAIHSDRKFCQFFTTFLHKELASATWILFGEDITPAAKTARLAANGPGLPLGGGGGGGGGGGLMGAGAGGAGHGPQRLVVSLSDEVQSKDRELAAANDALGPDRVHAMQRADESRRVLEDSARRGGSVADRWDYLGKHLDIDNNLAHAMVYRVVICTSLWGRGESADEFRLLSVQLGRNCAKHYSERVKIGTALWAKIQVFGVAFGKFLFGTYATSNDSIDFLLGPCDVDERKAMACVTEHDLAYIVGELTSILRDELFIDMDGFEVLFMDILLDLRRDHRVSIAILYQQVVKTVFRLFANLMDNKTGWLSQDVVCARPKPIQLIQASDKSRIDRGLPDATRNAAAQCIQALNDAKKTGVSNGHLDTDLINAQMAATTALIKQQASKLQSLEQAVKNKGKGKGRDQFGQPIDPKAGGVANNPPWNVPLPPGIAPNAPQPEPQPVGGAGAGGADGWSTAGGGSKRSRDGRKRNPMQAQGLLTSAFVTAWRDLACNRAVMAQGPNRCIFGDIATVPGYEAWKTKCDALELGPPANNHKGKKIYHAGEVNPTAAANPSHAKLVDTMPVHELSALLMLHSIPYSP